MSEDNRKRHGGIPPRPWRVEIERWGGDGDEECLGIYAADGVRVIVTDSGFYPPDIETAEFIVKCVNERKEGA